MIPLQGERIYPVSTLGVRRLGIYCIDSNYLNPYLFLWAPHRSASWSEGVISGATSTYSKTHFFFVSAVHSPFFNMLDFKKEKDIEGLTPSENSDPHHQVQNHDDVFGEITESGPNYRNVCSFFPSFFILQKHVQL